MCLIKKIFSLCFAPSVGDSQKDMQNRVIHKHVSVLTSSSRSLCKYQQHFILNQLAQSISKSGFK